MQVDAAGTLLTPKFNDTTYYATASALSTLGPIKNTTNHVSFYDAELDVTYCSHVTAETITPSSKTAVVAERSFLWLMQPVLNLAMTVNDCPISFIAPYCTGFPTSASSEFSHVMGYSLAKTVELTGSSIYMAKLTPVPGVTRIVLTSQSGPVDVVLIDEYNLERFSGGLNFRFYPWFSFFSVESLDKTVTLSGDMTGNYYYMITYAREGEKAVIKPASAHDATAYKFPIHSRLYKLSSMLAAAVEPPPTPLTVSVAISTVGVENTLIPTVSQAWSQELYVEGPSGALPTWLLGVIIAAGVVLLLAIMLLIICYTRRKDRGDGCCCRCCHKKPASSPSPFERRASLQGQSKPSAARRASLEQQPQSAEWPTELGGLASGPAERGTVQQGSVHVQMRPGVLAELGVLSPARKGLYSAYDFTNAKPSVKSPQKNKHPKVYSL